MTEEKYINTSNGAFRLKESRMSVLKGEWYSTSEKGPPIKATVSYESLLYLLHIFERYQPPGTSDTWKPDPQVEDPAYADPNLNRETRPGFHREPCGYRYHSMDWEFWRLMAEIADYGDAKHGEGNWKKHKATGDQLPINHAADHIRLYLEKIPHDHFGTLKHQLAAVAYNAMMECYWIIREEREKEFQEKLESLKEDISALNRIRKGTVPVPMVDS